MCIYTFPRFPTRHISELLPTPSQHNTNYALNIKNIHTWKNTKQPIRRNLFSLFFFLFQVLT